MNIKINSWQSLRSAIKNRNILDFESKKMLYHIGCVASYNLYQRLAYRNYEIKENEACTE